MQNSAIMKSNVIFVSSFLHFRVFLKDFLYAVAECYDIIFPWLNLLEDTQKVINLYFRVLSSQCLIPVSKVWSNLECCS